MDTHRIEGIKFNFDRLTDEELVNMRGHLLETHERVTDEITLLDETIFARQHPELPFEHTGEANVEHMLGRACMRDPDFFAPDALIALDNFHADEA